MKVKILILLVLGVMFPSLHAGEIPTPNTFGGDFTFDSTLGTPASLKQWNGKVVLLNFGFTSCPDVCPMVLSKLSAVQTELDDKAERIQVVFVTVDPERDDVLKMKNYLKHYHSSFVGMRGKNESEIKSVLKKYGAALESLETENGKSISHSDFVYVINQEGYVAGFYDVKSSPRELMSAVKKQLSFNFFDLF